MEHLGFQVYPGVRLCDERLDTNEEIGMLVTGLILRRLVGKEILRKAPLIFAA